MALLQAAKRLPPALPRHISTISVTAAQPHFDWEHDICTPINATPKWKAPLQAMLPVQSGARIFVHGMAATPTPLLLGLCQHAKEHQLEDIQLYHLLLEGVTPWADASFEGKIRSNSLFTGANLRSAVNSGNADTTSIFLSEIPWLFRRGQIRLDVALIQVSTPDRKGYCSLGTTVDCTRAATMVAKHIVAVVNPSMPRTHGDAILHTSHFDTLVFSDHHLYTAEKKSTGTSEVEAKIGRRIAEELVEDGATLQMGIGDIPDACLAALKDHKDLGVHTEMFSDGVLNLIRTGNISNLHKKIHPGRIVGSFIFGSRELYEFAHDNPMFMMGDISWVNDVSIIRQNPKVTAINSAIEIDLTGQIVSDSVGKHIVSGFGGQVDFIRGASLCNDGKGKPIIALSSLAKDGSSKIVPYIRPGAGVTTSRASAHYVVTEYGIAYIFGKNMRQRAYELIRLAHPNHREALEKAAYNRLKCMPTAD